MVWLFYASNRTLNPNPLIPIHLLHERHFLCIWPFFHLEPILSYENYLRGKNCTACCDCSYSSKNIIFVASCFDIDIVCSCEFKCSYTWHAVPDWCFVNINYEPKILIKIYILATHQQFNCWFAVIDNCMIVALSYMRTCSIY